MDSDRRYSDDEISQILDRATDVRGGPAPSSGDGMTLAELQDIGLEVGISPEAIAKAAAALDRHRPTGPSPTFLGVRIGVGRTVHLPRALTDQEWNRLVVDLRETFDARGKLRREGPFRQWSNGNLQALLEPTESGERLRLRTLKGDARPSLGMGAALLGLGVIGLVLSVLTGFTQNPDVLEMSVFFTVFGGILHAAGRIRLPRWAATRELQMEGIAERLTAAVERADGAGETQTA